MLLTSAGEKFTDRTRKALTVLLAAKALVSLGQSSYQRVASDLTYTLTVEGEDDIYAEVHKWVLAQVPPKRQRSLLVRSARTHHDVSPGGRGVEHGLRIFYDGRRSQTVELDGHRVRVTLEHEEVGRRTDGELGFGGWRRDRVVFTCHGVGARDAVLRVLEGMARARDERADVRLFGVEWDGWRQVAELGRRELDTVVLRAGQLEDLVADVERFLGDEERYNRLGIPWHRGYLFTGPPGTGKTSLARALAMHFSLDLYFIPLAALPNDAAFQRVLSNVPPRAVLLLEDIDIAHAARQRDDSNPGVSLSGLLNGLDGVMTPHGLITVLTTNRPEAIDPALLRPGRVDYRLELGCLDEEQLGRLAALGVGRPVAPPSLRGRQVAPAEVVGVIKDHLHEEPATVLAAVRRYLDAKPPSPTPPSPTRVVR